MSRFATNILVALNHGVEQTLQQVKQGFFYLPVIFFWLTMMFFMWVIYQRMRGLNLAQ